MPDIMPHMLSVHLHVLQTAAPSAAALPPTCASVQCRIAP